MNHIFKNNSAFLGNYLDTSVIINLQECDKLKENAEKIEDLVGLLCFAGIFCFVSLEGRITADQHRSYDLYLVIKFFFALMAEDDNDPIYRHKGSQSDENVIK